jgi:hypothetical protein
MEGQTTQWSNEIMEGQTTQWSNEIMEGQTTQWSNEIMEGQPSIMDFDHHFGIFKLFLSMSTSMSM